jgi:hypothetical protein
MKLNRAIFAVAVLALALVSQASASTIFTTILTGNQEVPPNGSPGTGFETAVLNDAMTQLTVSVGFLNLVSTTAMAHIHCCAAPGTNASVVLPFTGFPTGGTSGAYTHTFTLATDLTGITPANFTSALLAGNAYTNIHTAEFPGGEIRGQLAAVPEPGTFVLFTSVLGTLLICRARHNCRKRS